MEEPIKKRDKYLCPECKAECTKDSSSFMTAYYCKKCDYTYIEVGRSKKEAE